MLSRWVLTQRVALSSDDDEYLLWQWARNNQIHTYALSVPTWKSLSADPKLWAGGMDNAPSINEGISHTKSSRVKYMSGIEEFYCIKRPK